MSTGSIFNFNTECYELLEEFKAIAKNRLVASEILNVDETGINVDEKSCWIHTASNSQRTYFHP